MHDAHKNINTSYLTGNNNYTLLAEMHHAQDIQNAMYSLKRDISHLIDPDMVQVCFLELYATCEHMCNNNAIHTITSLLTGGI